MKFLLSVAFCALCCLSAFAQSWQPLTNQPPGISAGISLLLTDGTVICQDSDSSNWWKLTPDSSGSYVNGTWSQIASMPSGYGPLYFASAVLADGRVVCVGGEYNLSGTASWTNLGAVYDPVANTWTPLAAPSGWSQIGDAACAVLPNGQFLLADPLNTDVAVLDPNTMTWIQQGGTGKTDRNDEEGLTLLPDGTVLTVNAINAPNAQRFIPSAFDWISAGATPQSLEDPSSQELGPMVLRFDGTVWATGATGHTAIYSPPGNQTDPGTWVAGPDFPIVNGQQLDIADGPACLLPNGNVLCGASPGVFNPPTSFFEFDGTNLNPVPATPNSPGNPSYVGNMLMLPTGQVMYTDFSSDVEIYTPAGGPQDAWRPTISQSPSGVIPGGIYSIAGTQFNGLSQTNAYGDDSTNASNYPLVRITNNNTGNVFYCKTFGHSTMAVATGVMPTSTSFVVPTGIDLGSSTVQVVANGIPSAPTPIVVGLTPSISGIDPASTSAGGNDFTLTINGSNFQNGAVSTWTAGSSASNLTTTVVSASQITATVPAALIANPRSATVSVSNPGNLNSNAVSFTITNPVPSLSSITPSSVTVGSSDTTITATGSSFVSGAVVSWTSGATTTPLSTTYVSATQVTAVVPSSLLGTAGTATVTVANPGTQSSAGVTFTINNPMPSLGALTPASASAGTNAVTLDVTGSNFISGSTVEWADGSGTTALATTFVSSGELTASVPGSLLASAGTATVTVTTSGPGGGTSSGATFTINAPAIASLSPNTTAAGGASFTLTVNGADFLSGSTVAWNGAALTTTFVSSTQLTAIVPAADVALGGLFNVTAVNPGGSTSSPATFSVTNPVPVLSSISPNAIKSGHATFTLTVNGSKFVQSSAVLWNGSALATTFVSSTKLTATVPSSLVAQKGTALVSVMTPSPGGGTTKTLNFNIKN